MALQLDADGYLNNLSDWNEPIAQELAALESINLSPAHWELIELVRRYYEEFDHAPPMRPLVKWIKRRGRSRQREQHLFASPVPSESSQTTRPCVWPPKTNQMPIVLASGDLP